MKKEDFERFKKGRDLWSDIMSRENVLSEIEDLLQRKDELTVGHLYTGPGSYDYRINLDADVLIQTLETMKARHEETIKEWKRQFEAL